MWLIYAATRMPQLDSTVYLEMPGLRVVRMPGRPTAITALTLMAKKLPSAASGAVKQPSKAATWFW